MRRTCIKSAVIFLLALGFLVHAEEEECGTRRAWREHRKLAENAWSQGRKHIAIEFQTEATGFAGSTFGRKSPRYYAEVEQLTRYLLESGRLREAVEQLERIVAHYQSLGSKGRSSLPDFQKTLKKTRAKLVTESLAADLQVGKVKELERVGSQVMQQGIFFEGEKQHMIHIHGGQGSILADAAFLVEVPSGKKPSSLKIERAWLVRTHCMRHRWHQAFALELTRATRDGKDVPLDQPIELSPGQSTRLWIAFKPREVYQACDHFGVRFGLLLDGEAFELEAILDVIREEPMPDP